MDEGALKILRWPAEPLRKVCSVIPLEQIPACASLAEKMFAIMKSNNGIGLAANQVGVNKQLLVMSINQVDRVIINPVIIELGEEIEHEEGCLSYPHVYEKIRRPQSVTLTHHNLAAERIDLSLSGIEARCFLHEYDHLHGIGFHSRVSQLKGQRMLTRLRKLS